VLPRARIDQPKPPIDGVRNLKIADASNSNSERKSRLVVFIPDQLYEMSNQCQQKVVNGQGSLHNSENPNRLIVTSEQCYQKSANSRGSLLISVNPNQLVETQNDATRDMQRAKETVATSCGHIDSSNCRIDALRNSGRCNCISRSSSINAKSLNGSLIDFEKG